MHAYVNHITKVEFLIAFKAAFFASMIEENILGGFQGARLKPLDLERVLQRLNVKLQMLTLTRASLPANNPWVSKTLQTAQEATLQSEHIKDQIARH